MAFTRKPNPAEERRQAHIRDLLHRARRGDADAIAELNREHRVTRVWTEAEIRSYERGQR